MKNKLSLKTGRRQFIQAAGAASALGSVAIPRVFAGEGEGNTIQVALVGCGGRGTGAAADALRVSAAPLKLVAMADVFEDRLTSSLAALRQTFFETPEKIAIPEDQQFVGFDAYKKAMDVLRLSLIHI